jgi:hypothetical protein
VLLPLLAHEESLHGGSGAERGARHRIAAHRHPAHSGRPDPLSLGRDQLAQRAEAVQAQDGALGVHVVARLLPARQRDLADHERVLAQFRDQALPSGFSHVCRSLQKRSGSADCGR